MASNEIPRDRNKLYTLCDQMLAGLAMYEVALGVAQNTAARLRPLLEVRDASNNLVLPPVAGTGARNWELAFGNARAAKKNAVTAVQAADAQARAFMLSAKRHLSNFLGSAWSPAWAPVGFNNATLEIPDDEDQRLDLLKAMRSFLHLNPNMTVSTPLLAINVSVADSRITALENARGVRAACRTDVTARRQGRDAVEVVLRKRMSGLVEELAVLMPDDDPRWAAFGLNAPAGPVLPDKVTGLTMLAGPGSSNSQDWDEAARAGSYNILQRLAGETDFTVVLNVLDSDGMTVAIGTGESAEYCVEAVNEAGTGPRSDIVNWTQP